jgi:glutamate-ammonia-ligase adenylyltransferase
MRLRPTGSKGPVSVRLEAMDAYYAQEADTWEFMALTRGRVVWASEQDFGARVAQALEAALRRPRPGVDIAQDVRAMRDLMDRERRPKGFWDLKLSAGAQVDAEFTAQYRQLMAAQTGAPLTVSTLEALVGDPVLAESWRTHQQLGQLMACAFENGGDPDQEPSGFQMRLARAAGAPDFDTLKARLIDLRLRARRAFETALPSLRDGI